MIFLVVAFAAMGLLLLADAALVRRRRTALRSWTRTEASVTRSSVRTVGGVPHVEFEYRYVHQGRPYHGSRVKAGADNEVTPATPEMAAVVHGNPEGTTVEILFDPESPEESCVLVGGGAGVLLRTILALLLLAAAVAIGIAALS